jgi:hypothetical protein
MILAVIRSGGAALASLCTAIFQIYFRNLQVRLVLYGTVLQIDGSLSLNVRVLIDRFGKAQ